MRRLLRPIVHRLVKRGSHAYSSGNTVGDAFEALRRYSEAGWRCTVCAWDKEGDSVDLVVSRYMQTLELLIAEKIDGYMSIKAPSLGYRRELVEELLAKATPHGIRLHFDAMDPESVDRTYSLAEELRPNFSNLGITAVSRWKRTSRDLRRIIDLNLPVRIVKGEWCDPEGGDADHSRRYIELAQSLVGKVPLVEVATHNPLLAEKVFRDPVMVRGAELSQLYGLPTGTVRAVPASVVKRIYVPYGEPSLPYQFSQMPSNPKLAWWFFRDVFRAKSRNFADETHPEARPQ